MSPAMTGGVSTTEQPGKPQRVEYFHPTIIPPLSCLLAAATAKSLQSCPTLCDPIDSSPPAFPIPGILQTRMLEWGAIVCLAPTSSCDDGQVPIFYQGIFLKVIL